MKHPCGDGKVLYLDCINVSIIAMYCSLARYSQKDKLGEA